MDLNKFTERSRGFIQAAQTIAMRENHQRLAPEHILKALLDDDQGLASRVRVPGGACAGFERDMRAANTAGLLCCQKRVDPDRACEIFLRSRGRLVGT